MGPQQLRHQGARERGGEGAARPGAPGGWGAPLWRGVPIVHPGGQAAGKREKRLGRRRLSSCRVPRSLLLSLVVIVTRALRSRWHALRVLPSRRVAPHATSPPSAALRESDAAAPCDRRVPRSCRAAVLPFAVRARPVVRNTGWAKMSRKAKFMLDEHRTPDGDGQAGAGGEEDRVLSPTTNQRAAPRGDLTGSESRRRAPTGERARHGDHVRCPQTGNSGAGDERNPRPQEKTLSGMQDLQNNVSKMDLGEQSSSG